MPGTHLYNPEKVLCQEQSAVYLHVQVSVVLQMQVPVQVLLVHSASLQAKSPFLFQFEQHQQFLSLHEQAFLLAFLVKHEPRRESLLYSNPARQPFSLRQSELLAVLAVKVSVLQEASLDLAEEERLQ